MAIVTVSSLSFEILISLVGLHHHGKAENQANDINTNEDRIKNKKGGESSNTLASSINNDSIALVVLNQPIQMSKEQFQYLWDKAKFIVCADGGANRLFNFFDEENDRNEHLPSLIVGDLDSIDQKIADYYSSRGVSVEKNECQITTDFQKCLLHPLFISASSVGSTESKKGINYNRNSHTEGENIIPAFVLGALTGRLDHCMDALHTLHLFPNRRIILSSNDSVAWLLKPDTLHLIYSDSQVEGNTCALFPLSRDKNGKQAVCSTTGLEWNLDHSMPMEFGSLISTSNKFSCSSTLHQQIRKVTVCTTSVPLIWTIELKRHPSK